MTSRRPDGVRRRGGWLAGALVVLALGLVAVAVPVIATGERGLSRCHRFVRTEAESVRVVGWSWRDVGVQCLVTRTDGGVERHVVRGP